MQSVMHNFIGTAIIVAGLLFTAQSRANLITGNPLSDGWVDHGDSLAAGTFIRETASWNFDVFSAAFTLSAGNALVNGTTWQVGDQILGMGGVLNGAQPILPRLVAKFGTTAATFKPSTTAAPDLPPATYNNNGTVSGNGTGSFSAAGNGGFMVTYGFQSDYPSYALDPASQNGAIITTAPGNLYYLTGGVQKQLSSGDFGKVIANFATNSTGALVTQNNQNGSPSSMPVLQTFEAFLNLSDLGRAGYTLMPSALGTGDMTLQFKTSSYTDAFVGEFNAPLTVGAVPEPGMLGLLGLGGVALLIVRRRQK